MSAPRVGDDEEGLLNTENFLIYKDQLRQQMSNRVLDPEKLNM